MDSTVLKFEKKTGYDALIDKNGSKVPHLFRSRHSGVIFYRKSLNRLGIPPIFESTGETTLGRAKTAADVLLQRHKNRHLGINDAHVFGRVATKTFREVAEEVMREHTPTLRLTTQENHKIYFDKLTTIFGSRDINSISLEEFNREIRSLKARGERETFADYAKHMNLAMRYAYNQKYASHLIRFPNPDKGRRKAGRRYTPKEIEKLWAYASEPMKDQFVLAFENAMRLREMLYLTWERLNLETGELILRPEDVKTGSKTGRGRRFILSPGALERMRARRQRFQKTAYVFESPRVPGQPQHDNKKAWETLKGKAGITGTARWHDLRHTALTIMLLEKRLNPLAVSEFAGVSIATIQKVYLKPEAKHTADVGLAVKIGDGE